MARVDIFFLALCPGLLSACGGGGGGGASSGGGAPVPLSTAVAYVKASNTGADDNFGYVIALSADGNTRAVGAYGEDSNATGVGGNQADNAAPDAGAVYLY